MANIKSDRNQIFLLFFVLIIYTTTVNAMDMDMDMDHSKQNTENENQKNKDVSPWPKNGGVDAWADEEFANESLSDELNTEIGIVVHHQHKSGNWMVGYKYMNMFMEGLISGTQETKGNNPVTTEQIARTQMGITPPIPVADFDYSMAPIDMTMKMHMLTAMYGFSENTSLMIMTKYLRNDMNMVMHMGNTSSIVRTNYSAMETNGISDTVINTMIRASDTWTISLGMSVPTGSIDEKVVMNDNSIQAPYKMQLGSGTFDFLQAVTYKGGDSSLNWGLQQSFIYRSGSNENGYALGNKFEVSTWFRKTSRNQFSISVRLNLFDEEKIEGRDINIMNSSMSPTFNAQNSGRHEIDMSVGFSKRFISGNRLGFEYSKPISQTVNGIQMESQYAYTLSWSYMM